MSSPRRRRRKAQRRQLLRPENPGPRQTCYDIIFEAESRAGRGFDIALLFLIILSIVVVALETVPEYNPVRAAEMGLQAVMNPPTWTPGFFYYTEWVVTVLFTVEYGLRLWCVRRPWQYAFSFWGVIDLVSIIPSYLAFGFGAGSRSFTMIRGLRLLRVFRVMKLWRMMSDADELSSAVWHSRHKITVFLTVVLVAVTLAGSLVYQVETTLLGDQNSENEFTSIPQAMYWAVVTMTTVGYGDVVPHTVPGKMISAALILLGYSLIIVPTGFVGAEFAAIRKETLQTEQVQCGECSENVHLSRAAYCHRCGEHLDS